MQTTIQVDDCLITEAMQASGAKTPREVVERALRLLARQADMRRLYGAVTWEGDLDADRLDLPRRGDP